MKAGIVENFVLIALILIVGLFLVANYLFPTSEIREGVEEKASNLYWREHSPIIVEMAVEENSS